MKLEVIENKKALSLDKEKARAYIDQFRNDVIENNDSIKSIVISYYSEKDGVINYNFSSMNDKIMDDLSLIELIKNKMLNEAIF